MAATANDRVSEGDAVAVAASGRRGRWRVSGPRRWRIVSLALVHLAIAAHILHWRLAGESLSSVQLSDAGRFAAEGVATAAFFLLAALVVVTVIFGRVFCAWGCHMLALQEACRALLQHFGVRPKLVRSRIVWVIPFAAAFRIFLWPAVERWWRGAAIPTPAVQLSTSDLWANLPGPVVAVATFVLIGVGMVYLLGSLSFCKYVCPYGAVFATLENLSLGRIRLTGSCDGCARCTAACPTGVRVHTEVQRLGLVANTGCMRCFECVSACPRDVLAYRFGKPAVMVRNRRGLTRYSFSWAEEGLLLVLFVTAVAALHGLYDGVPLLFSLAAAVVVAYLGVVALRCARHPFVALRNVSLKISGRLTRAGITVLVAVVAVYAFVGHSLMIRYHDARADAALRHLGFPSLLRVSSDADAQRARDAAWHLERCERLGLVDTVDWNMKSAWIHRILHDPPGIERHLRRAIALGPEMPAARFNLGRELLRQGRHAEAAREFAHAVRLDPALDRFLPPELSRREADPPG